MPKKLSGKKVAQSITTCLWFDGKAEEAAKFYTLIFKNSRIGRVARYGEVGQEVHGQKAGTVMSVEFEILGQKFLGLNGGPMFKFTEAISFIVNCETQEEIDELWAKLTEGGDEKAQQCGWLKDKFGLSWQIVPAILAQMMADKDPHKSERVMKAFLPMKKLDIEILKRAFEGNS